jgi:hypothetical protein
MTIICCLQFTGRDILALDCSFPALYLRLHYDSKWAASTRRRLASRAKRLTTLSLLRAFVLARFVNHVEKEEISRLGLGCSALLGLA